MQTQLYVPVQELPSLSLSFWPVQEEWFCLPPGVFGSLDEGVCQCDCLLVDSHPMLLPSLPPSLKEASSLLEGTSQQERSWRGCG